MAEARPSSSSGKTDINLDSGATAALRMGTGANEGLGTIAQSSQILCERVPFCRASLCHKYPKVGFVQQVYKQWL